MALVYRHRKKTNVEVFYIGISKDTSRVSDFSSRNRIWKYIYNKHDVEIDIIADHLSLNDAFELEQLLILEYGRIDLKTGSLANMTTGGDGVNGLSEDGRKRLSDSKKGSIPWNKGKKGVQTAWNKGLIGHYNLSYETRLKVSNNSPTSRPVAALNDNDEIVFMFKSAAEASIIFTGDNYKRKMISRVCSGQRKHYKGYKWEYI